jgi:hypothetical protein
MELVMDVQFPEQALATSGRDLLSPLKELEQGLGILPDDKDLAKSGAAATFTGPPDSVAIIEAGATALSKWWSVAIGSLGGAAVITSAATKFWNGQTGAARVALIGGMAGLLVAALIAISLIVAADVRGRAQATVALYAARATIAAQFLQASLSISRPASVSDDTASGTTASRANTASSPADLAAATSPRVGASSAVSQVPIYLAASSAPALVLHRPTNQAGHLAGVRQLDDGTTQLLFVRESDHQTTWCAATEVTVTEFTYLPEDSQPERSQREATST